MEKVLVTGGAGFIGFHVCKSLIDNGYYVVNIDNLNEYYDIQLKINRLKQLNELNNYEFHKIDLINKQSVFDLFESIKPKYIINLAAQAGVRYSLENPQVYIDSNITGFVNILEACRKYPVKHLIYASSSSVYGENSNIPFSTSHKVDHPVSLYAASKKFNELIAHTYSHLYNIPTTGLRFFTVYGPWGRPDMAYFIFTKSILNGDIINLYNYGEMERDFTYIDDVVEGIMRLLNVIPNVFKTFENTTAPYSLYNIGNSTPIKLKEYIAIIEDRLCIQAKKKYVEMQPGDVPKTYADISDLENDIGFKPSTTIKSGIDKFITWYLEYYKVNQ